MEQRNNNYGRDQNVFNQPESVYVYLQSEEDKTVSITYLLKLDIQQDCNLLQELLEQKEQDYLPERWQSCFSQNRIVWQDMSSRLLLVKSKKILMQDIQFFIRN